MHRSSCPSNGDGTVRAGPRTRFSPPYTSSAPVRFSRPPLQNQPPEQQLARGSHLTEDVWSLASGSGWSNPHTHAVEDLQPLFSGFEGAGHPGTSGIRLGGIDSVRLVGPSVPTWTRNCGRTGGPCTDPGVSDRWKNRHGWLAADRWVKPRFSAPPSDPCSPESWPTQAREGRFSLVGRLARSSECKYPLRRTAGEDWLR